METKDKMLIKADLPGLEGSYVDVSISGNVLTIKGKRNRKRKKRTNTGTTVKGITVLFSVPFSFR